MFFFQKHLVRLASRVRLSERAVELELQAVAATAAREQHYAALGVDVGIRPFEPIDELVSCIKFNFIQLFK